MTQEQMDRYKLRITQAGIGEFVVIMLEMEMQWIDEGLAFYEAHQEAEFLDCMEKAQAVQQHLIDVLNLENEVARDVYSVFVYINRQLIYGKIKKQPLDLSRCKNMLEKYHKSFEQIAGTDTLGPIMAAGEKVYAGLTYGSSGLVESSTGGMDFTV